MQQSVVGDSDARQQIANQVLQWEENLERLHCEQFRLRCYMASLQSGELPNPKVCAQVFLSACLVWNVFAYNVSKPTTHSPINGPHTQKPSQDIITLKEPSGCAHIYGFHYSYWNNGVKYYPGNHHTF